MRSRSALAWFGFLSASLGVATVVACGSTNGDHNTGGGFSTSSGAPGGAGGSLNEGGGFGVGGNQQNIKSLEVKPATAKLDVNSGASASLQLKAIAHYQDGSTGDVTATWSADALAIGSVSGGGKFTANGAQGGLVDVTASAGGQKATAKITVVLHVSENPAMADAGTQAKLKGATTADGSVVWAYPYDKTVFPRGIGAPILQWNNAAAPDIYYVHITSDTFELESFTTAPPPSRYQFTTGVWDQFANSTSGAAQLKVARFDGTNATVIVDHRDQIANGAMHGTIYYWSIGTGRIMRIQPGAVAPDDLFAAGNVACPSCHTVSADGSTLLMNTAYATPGNPPQSANWPYENSVNYDLDTNMNSFLGLASNGAGASPFALGGISADGKYLLENFAPLRGNIAVKNNGQDGVFDAKTAAHVTGTGIDSLEAYMPAFSADNKLLAYVDGPAGDLHALDWDGTVTPPKGSNDRVVVKAGTDATLKYINGPTVTPDHKWVIYQRSDYYGSLCPRKGNLYMAPVVGANDQPGTEVPLDALNGTGYPFAAGNRDLDYNYEPTIAPIASGGYFWLVFHSRRTYGNIANTKPAYQCDGNGNGIDASGMKLLWVAAIDIDPQAGKDASHPAFLLPGQDVGTLNMRGYWSLPPCKADGKSCETGSDCCGGYCDVTGDAGGGVCKSNSGGGCSGDGDKCQTASDCCDSGSKCINDHCAVSIPK